MSSLQASLFGMVVSCAVVVACVNSGDVDNDNTAGMRQGIKDAGQDAAKGKDAKASEPSDDSDQSSSTDDTSTDDTSSDQSSSDDTMTPPETDAGDDAAAAPADAGAVEQPHVIAGSATKAMCSSYGKAKAPMCAGYFCGVTQDQIAAEMPADTLCGDMAAEGACDGKLTTAVSKCARDVKSANPLASDDQLRPMVQDCVYQDADLKAKTPEACLGCFLDAATCAGDNCLIECLAGDSKSCDSCRAQHDCDTPVFACAKIPNPF